MKRHPLSTGCLSLLASVGAALAVHLAWHDWFVTVATGLGAGALVRGAFDLGDPEVNGAAVLAALGSAVGVLGGGVPAYLLWGTRAAVGLALGGGALLAIAGALTGLAAWPRTRRGIDLGGPDDFPWGARSTRWWHRVESWVEEGRDTPRHGGTPAPEP